MKKGLIISLILLTTCMPSVYGQFSFGVSPGIGLNGAYFGYKINNKLVPSIGFQHLNANFKYEESGRRYSLFMDRLVNYSESNEFSGNLYMPELGLKYFIKQQNQLQAYFSVNLSKPMLKGKIKNDGRINEDFEKGIKNISM
jgi:hypothetical protein